MSNEIRLPAISCGFKKEEELYTVQIAYEGGWVSVGTQLARHLATDLLIWADRVEKLNGVCFSEKHLKNPQNTLNHQTSASTDALMQSKCRGDKC